MIPHGWRVACGRQSKSGKIRVADIYRQMASGNQTDKEFAIGGSTWRSCVATDRMQNFAVGKNAVREIIEESCIDKLRA